MWSLDEFQSWLNDMYPAKKANGEVADVWNDHLYKKVKTVCLSPLMAV